MIDARPVTAEDAARLVDLFDAAGSACFCRWLSFTGDKNDWLMRCAQAPAENRRELEEGLRDGRADTLGVVAVEGEALVGWMKVAPALVTPKAYEQRFYRALPCLGGPREGVFLIGCALVHPSARRRGIATALVGAAVALARSRGARAIEALPRRPRGIAERDEELWTVPVAALEAHGLTVVGGEDPYPVMRRELAS